MLVELTLCPWTLAGGAFGAVEKELLESTTLGLLTVLVFTLESQGSVGGGPQTVINDCGVELFLKALASLI